MWFTSYTLWYYHWSKDARGKRKNNLKVTRCGKVKLTVGTLDDQNINILNLDEQYSTSLKKTTLCYYLCDGRRFVCYFISHRKSYETAFYCVMTPLLEQVSPVVKARE